MKPSTDLWPGLPDSARDLRRALLGLLLVAIAGCAGAPTAPTPEAPARTPETPREEAGAVPDAAGQHYAAALDLLRRERFREAEISLEAMTRAYPDLAGPWINLGIIHARLGRSEAAEQAFRNALERNPRSAVTYNLLGLLYREAGRFEDARKAYEAALGIDERYADAHLNLAILNDLYLQRLGVALAHYERYRQLEGDADGQVERWVADLRQRIAASRESAGSTNRPAAEGGGQER